MKIGELAKRTGCKPVTIRFYEKKGLMPLTQRTEGNYRNYDEKDLARLAFIRHCRMHGMTLEEIDKLLCLSVNSAAEHDEIHALIKGHLVNIQKQIGELQQLKSDLEGILGKCEGKGDHCDILESLGNKSSCSFCKHNKALHQDKDLS